MSIIQNSRDGSRRWKSVVTNSWNVLYLAGDDKRLSYAYNCITNGSLNRSVHVGWHYSAGVGRGGGVDD